MNKEKRRVPKLRFPGFTEDWEQRKLGDYLSIPEKEILEVKSANDLLTVKLNLGGVELGASRDTLSLGSTVYYKRYAGQFIYGKQNFFNGSMGIIPQKLDGKGSSGDVPSFNISNIEANYLYAYVSRESYWRPKVAAASGTGSKRIHEKTLLDFNIDIPSINEQKLISNTFDLINRFITLHQRKLEHLNLKKKALLQKLFPKNGERHPELRFPGFTDAWEQRKLESLFTKYEDKVKTPNSGYWRLGLRSHCKGTFHTYVDAGNELETAEMNRVQSGNFILNITFAWERALAVTNEEDQDKLVSHRFPQFKPNRDLAIDFFKHTLMDKRFKHHLELSSPGGAGRNKVLKIADMLKYELLVPSIKEQNEISSFLNNVDYIITLHQRKLEHLQLQKKALLQQMFV